MAVAVGSTGVFVTGKVGWRRGTGWMDCKVLGIEGVLRYYGGFPQRHFIMNNAFRNVILCSAALGGLPTVVLAADPFDALGSAGDYTILGMADAYTGTSSGFVQLGSAAHVYGDVGARHRIETAAGVVIEGDAHYGPGGALHGGNVRGADARLSEADWAAVQADAHAAVDAAFELDATVLSGARASACSGTPTASGSVGSHHLMAARDDEGLSVYEFDGCLYLGDGDTLTIEGTTDDRFVIRVTGGFRMDEGAAVVLDGVPGSAVMFVFDSGGWASDPWGQVTVWDGSTSDGAALSGVIVAPWMYWQFGDGTDLPDTRVLVGGIQANIQDMYSTGTITGSPIETEPEEDHPNDQDDETCTGDDHPSRPDWEVDWRCPPRDWQMVIEADPSGPIDEADDATSGAPYGTEESRESNHPSTVRPMGKAGTGCATAGLGAGLWMAWLGLAAVGARRRPLD